MNKTKQLASAQMHMRKGHYRKAIAAYERVLTEDPLDVRARLNLANLYYRREDYPRAVEAFLEVAKTYEETGATLKAIAVYKQAIKLAPERADLFVLLAHNYEQHGLLNEAGSSYKQALRLLSGEGDTGDKLDVIKRILELDPVNLVDRVRLAEAYSALGHLNDAVRQFRRVALELDRLGHTQAFQRIGERLLYHQPDDAIIAKKLATSYVVAREPHRALSKLKIAFKHTPRDLEVLGTLVDAFVSLGQVHKAVTVLKEMARQYDKSGLVHERDDCYREILTLDPDHDLAIEHVRPRVSAAEGQTIQFDGGEPAASGPQSADEPPPLPPPLPTENDLASEPPPLPPSRPPTTGDVAAEAAIEQMLRESLEADMVAVRDAVEGRSARPVSDKTAGQLEALFAAGLEEINPSVSPDERTYQGGTAADDNSPGFDAAEPERTDVDVKADTPKLRVAPSDQALAEGLQKLDFYLTRTLISEAQSLLDDLQQRYHDHPELTRRAETLARMAS